MNKLAVLAVLVWSSQAVAAEVAGNLMSPARENALVARYCAVCHTDAARNGGLSLEHFDAARVAPSLAAMMLSKVTGGVSLKTAKAASSDPGAAALVATKMRSGAMGAAGIPIPDRATIDAFIEALASEATGATEWNVSRTDDPATRASIEVASILREASAGGVGEAVMYRLVLSCNAAAQKGEMQLAWAPLSKTGSLTVVADGGTPLIFRVEGKERMGNGSNVTGGPSAIALYESGSDSGAPGMLLPKKSLYVGEISPGESVEFPFGDLDATTRQSLVACFRP